MKVYVLIASSVLILTSCNDKKSSPQPQVDPICGDKTSKIQRAFSKCMSKADWTINVNREDFPARAKFLVGGAALFDECGDNNHEYSIVRSGAMTSIKIPDFVYVDDQVKLTFVDRGACDVEEIYLDNPQMTFTRGQETSGKKTINIEIGI